ncbi:MAG: hypothetical protein ACLFP4_10405 [Spirochaetales bacterium]
MIEATTIVSDIVRERPGLERGRSQARDTTSARRSSFRDPGSPSSRAYHEGNLGGLTLQLGLVAEF